MPLSPCMRSPGVGSGHRVRERQVTSEGARGPQHPRPFGQWASDCQSGFDTDNVTSTPGGVFPTRRRTCLRTIQYLGHMSGLKCLSGCSQLPLVSFGASTFGGGSMEAGRVPCSTTDVECFVFCVQLRLLEVLCVDREWGGGGDRSFGWSEWHVRPTAHHGSAYCAPQMRHRVRVIGFREMSTASISLNFGPRK